MTQIALMFSLLACSSPPADKPAPTPVAKPVEKPSPPPAVPALPKIPEGAKIHFVEPKDGATVTSPLKVVFGAENLVVEAAGEAKAGAGHHHLILDGRGPNTGDAVPKDATHIHYGKGQTETMVELTKGDHLLTMQFADGLHRSYGEPLRATIKVTVE